MVRSRERWILIPRAPYTEYRVYTSLSNKINVTSATRDPNWIQCSWTMIPNLTTNDFKRVLNQFIHCSSHSYFIMTCRFRFQSVEIEKTEQSIELFNLWMEKLKNRDGAISLLSLHLVTTSSSSARS